MAKKIASLSHACPAGHIWDPALGRCIPIVKGSKLAKAPENRVRKIYGFK